MVDIKIDGHTDLEWETAHAFNAFESENNFYRGDSDLQRALQRAVLGVYESRVVPLQEENSQLKLDSLLGSVGVENAPATERWLIGQVESWIKNSREDHNNKMPEGWALLLVDLDGLKQINGEDNQGVKRGHDMGDAALIMLGRSLAIVCRVEDKVGRVGGDEFLLIIPAKKDNWEEVMMGKNGVVSRLRHKIGEGRAQLREIFKGRWPEDTSNRKLAEASIGLDYLTREQIIEIYLKFKSTSSEKLLTNFTGYLRENADKALFVDKDRYSEGA